MEFEQVVRQRRMVRDYRDEPVPTESIERIVSLGRRAPSAGFAQGTYLVVVTDAAMRLRIAELAGEPEYVDKGFTPWVSRAPVHIVLCSSERDYHDRYREPDKLRDGSEIEWPIPYWWIDAGAVMMTVLLAAVDEGLAAGFLSIPAVDDLRKVLAIPDHVTPVGVITIGHQASDRVLGSARRGWKPIEDVVHRERWHTSK